MTDRGKLRLYIQYLFILFLTFLVFPNFFSQLPKPGIDSSWNIALHLANKYEMIFGKDLVFTYGPFGVLSTRLSISVSKYFYLFFDLYFLCTFIFVVRKIFTSQFNFAIAIFAFCSVIVAMYEAQEQWYFFFMLFFLFSYLKEPLGKTAYLIQAAFIAIFCFYYKLGLGISSIAIFLMVITYAVARKKLPLLIYILLILSFVFGIWLCARIFHVDLPGYLKGSMHLIDAYNDSMFVPLPSNLTRFGNAAIVIIVVVTSWILYRLVISIRKKEIIKNLDELFIYLIFSMAVYVLFKSSFVRTDGHLFLFSKSMSLVITLLYLFSPRIPEKKYTAIACWMVVVISLWTVNTIPGSYKPVNKVLDLSFIGIKVDETRRYFDALKNYDTAVAQSNQLMLQDNEFKKIIGNNTADIIPTEISKLYFNGLRYNPRPVIQSYSAYDGYLDSVNFDKYMSPNAPDYVLFTLKTIDDRFAFFDETKTKIALINHYRVLGEVGGELLLKKRDSARNLLQLKEEENLTITLGEDIPIKKNTTLQLSRVFIEYNLWGKLRRLLYQPPAIRIFFTLENGEVKSFRVSKSILEGGVILNKFVDNEQEFQLLMQSDGKLNSNVKTVRFESDPANTGLIRTARMENIFYQYPDKPAAEAAADSIAIAALMSRYKPVIMPDSIAVKPDSLRYRIEDFSAHGQTIRVSGWAFAEDASNKDCLVKAILKSGDVIYELASEKKYRPDLPVVFKRDDLEYSGINSLVSKSQLPAGDYLLGIGIFSPDNKTVRVTYTDHHISINNPVHIQKITRIAPSSSTDQIAYNIDVLQEEENNIFIQGWAFQKNATGKTDSTNLILQSQTETYRIHLPATKRIDVATIFKNPLLEFSGFSFNLSKEKLPKGDYNIGIEKVSDTDHKHSFIQTGKTIKIGDGSFSPSPLDTEPLTKKINATIDQLVEGNEFITISGWAVDEINNVNDSKIKIILKSDASIYSSETNLKSRPDVTTYLKSPVNIDNCGFSAKISKKDLKKGKYEIGIAVYQKANKAAVKFTGQFVSKN